MPRTCTVCNHAERDAIDQALVSGESARDLSAKYRVSEDAITRHRARHRPAALADARAAAEVTRADDLLGQVQALQTRTLGVLAKAEAAGELRTVLQAVREARGNLELLARLLGELRDTAPTVNVALVTAPEWLALRSAMLRTLEPFPEARHALVQALDHVKGDDKAGPA